MIPIVVRVILFLFCSVAAIYKINEGSGTWVLYFSAAFLFTAEHFRGGEISLAFQSYAKGKPEKVRRILQRTYKPEWLRPSTRSYYYFLSAVVNTVDGDLNGAKNNLLEAIKYPFRTDHIKCLAHMFLAEVYLDLGEVKEGAKYFELAKGIDRRAELDPMLAKLGARIEGMA
jgi:hypothetical protein